MSLGENEIREDLDALTRLLADLRARRVSEDEIQEIEAERAAVLRRLARLGQKPT